MTRFLSAFSPRYPRTIVYMLQSSEYDAKNYLAWVHKTTDFSKVAKRRQLDMTSKAKGLLLVASALFFGLLLVAISLLAYGLVQGNLFVAVVALPVLLLVPVLTAYGIVIPLRIGYYFIQRPKQKRIIETAKTTLDKHPATKIAIAGSYGKTTFREQLNAVLSAGKKTAAAPGNFNTPLGISRFAAKLTGDEEILIFEFGEHYPGDVRELCELAKPHIGVITGINESHLEKFKSIEKTVATIFELKNYLGDKPVYKNVDNTLVAKHTDDNDPLAYSSKGANGWKVTKASATLEGTSFTATKGSRVIKAESQLLGTHMVGVLVACIAIADDLGLSDEQIERGIAATQPYEHRMQPRQVNGATVIDDTYNGNSDGVRAGLTLLKQTDVEGRRIYVTPGLVEQGKETANVHKLMGELIAESSDKVYLMKNSTTPYILEGINTAGYAGDVTIIDEPLEFYTNLEQYVAKGDVVLMQNDWTDNYH